MKKLLVGILLLLASVVAHGQVISFPSAEGFGRFATGGRGGSVCKVTSLGNSGAGTFRDCVLQSGPRTVVFDTSGEISLTSEIKNVPDDITIAGQTAPGDGVFITGGGLWLDGTNNAIVRHVRIMVGDAPSNPNSRDSARSGDNQIWDHNTILWSVDENFDVFGDDVTLQYNIISEALRSAGHGDGNHSRGLMVGSGSNYVRRGSFMHNLITDTDGRTPIIYNCNPCDYFNNVTYNAGDYVLLNARLEPLEINVFGNYFLRGPNFDRNYAYRTVQAFSPAGDIWYYGNCDDRDRPTDTESQQANLDKRGGYVVTSGINDRFTSGYPSYTIETDCLSALSSVPNTAGASQPTRLSLVESRIGNSVINETGTAGIVDLADTAALTPSISVVSGPTDTDGDGMPDDWETNRSLNPASASDGPATAANGYTNLENYINCLAGDDIPGVCDAGGGGSDPLPIPDAPGIFYGDYD